MAEIRKIDFKKQIPIAHSLEVTGKHHEIYLNDPRKTAPEKLRTIVVSQ